MFVVVTRDTQGVFGLWPDEMDAISGPRSTYATFGGM